MAVHLRPVLGQHALAERVDLDLPDDVNARPLQAEVESADAGEDRHRLEVLLGHRAVSGAAGGPTSSRSQTSSSGS